MHFKKINMSVTQVLYNNCLANGHVILIQQKWTSKTSNSVYRVTESITSQVRYLARDF